MATGKKIISIGDTKMFSVRKTAGILGCAPDYVGRLCREGKLDGVLYRGAWVVDPASISRYEAERDAARAARADALSAERRTETLAYVYAGKTLGGKAVERMRRLLGIAPAAAAAVRIAPKKTGSWYYRFGRKAFLFAIAIFFAAAAPLGAYIQRTFFAPAPIPAETRIVVLGATSTPATSIINKNTYPIRERTIERLVAASSTDLSNYVTYDFLAQQVDRIAHASRGSSGGITDFSTLAASDIPDLSGTYLPLTGGTLSGSLSLTSASTTATSTLAGLTLTTDCSVYNNGGKLTTDASGNVICDNDNSSAGSGSPGGSNTQVQFNDSGSFGGDAGFTYSKTADRLTVTYASTTGISTTYASTTNLVISGVSNSLLKTVNGVVTSAVAGTDYQAAGNYATFSYPFPSNATTTLIAFNGGLTAAGATTTALAVTGSTTISSVLNVGGVINASGGVVGNASTATALQTGRTINGITFDGTANITVAAASSTLLANDNTWSGTNTFSNPIVASITGNAATVTNGVYTTTFNSLFDARFVTDLAATTSVASITALPNLSILSSQVSDLATTIGAAYPFPSNATTTLLAFNGGLTAAGATTTALAVTGSSTISSVLNVGGALNANGALTVVGDTTLANATSTSFAISNISSGNLLKTTTGGAIIAAVAGTDYQTVLTGTQGQLAYFSGTNTAVGTSSLFASSTGNIGIGTIVPYGRLAVSSANLSQAWALVGSSANDVNSSPRIAGLSPNRIAEIDATNAELATFEFNGSTWSQVGNGFSLSGTTAASITALSANQVAYYATTHNLRVYEFNGTDWVAVGSSFSTGAGSATAMAALSRTRVAFSDAANDTLRMYEFNGSTWSQVGSSLALTSFATAQAMVALSANRIAFIDFTNDTLRTYEFNGSTWSQVGTGLAISTVGTPSLAVLSPSRVALTDSTGDSLRTYEFNGQAWSQVGTALSISASSNQAITALSPNRIAYDDGTVIRTYQFSSPLLHIANSADFPYLQVSDAGYTTAEALGVRTTLTVGQSATSTAASSTPALIVTGTSVFSSNVGLGTSSPYAMLSINPQASTSIPSFLIGSSTRTDLVVTQAGNVGIGTTSPSATLDIGLNGNTDLLVGSSFSKTISVGGSSFGRIGISGGAEADLYMINTGAALNSKYFQMYNAGAGLGFKSLTDALDLRAEALFLTSAGNAGIGSTTPWARLSVDTSSLGSGVPSFVVGSSTRTDLIVTQAGNVGVGTTSPTQAVFSVVGNNNSSGNMMLIQNTNSGSSAYAGISFLGDTSSGASLLFNSSGNSNLGGANSLNIFQPNNAPVAIHTSGLERFRVTGDGNVGIGTTSPAYQLTVEQTLDSAVTLAARNWSNGNSAKARFLALSDSGAADMAFTSSGYSAIAGGADALVFNTFNASGGIQFAIEGVTQVKIDSSGKVGIGTTTPVSTLSVQGSLCVRNTGSCGTTDGTIYATTAAITDIDLAENYRVIDQTIAAGEIVALEPEEESTVKRAQLGERPIGIVSTAPGLLLGQDIVDGLPIALKGRVPLKVNLEGGPIKAGDAITLSSVAGIGTKATTTALQVAIALQDSVAGSGTQVIEVFVQNGVHFAPDTLAGLGALGEVATTSDLLAAAAGESFMSNVLKNVFAYVAARLGEAGNGIADLFATRVHVETVYAQTLCLGATCVSESQLRALLNGAGSTGSAPATTAPAGGSATDTASTTPPDAAGTPPAGAAAPAPAEPAAAPQAPAPEPAPDTQNAPQEGAPAEPVQS